MHIQHPFPRRGGPCQPAPPHQQLPAAHGRARRKVRVRRRENSSFSQPGRERERIPGKKLPYSTAVHQWKKKNKYPGSFHRWFGHRNGRHKTDPHDGERWDGDRHLGMSSPAKSYGHRSCCLSSCKLLANLIPGKGWGQILVQERQGIATPVRRLHGGTRTGQEGGNPGQIQLQEPLGPGTLLSTMKHPRTPGRSPAPQQQGHTFPAPHKIIWLILLLSFFIFFFLKA